MTTLRCLDSQQYIAIREGVCFYYFGSGCIADYYLNSIAYLDEATVTMIRFCTGNMTVQEVTEKVASETAMTAEDAIKQIETMRSKGVIVLRNKPTKSMLIFHGKKGFYYPKEMAIELTNICNYYCPFCYKNANRTGEFMSRQIFDTLYQTIYGNVKNILLTGGEPTLHPEYLSFINVLTEFADVHMISNGSVLFEHDPSILCKLSKIQLSIYGCSDDECRKMTGVNDSFTRLCKSAEFLNRNGINMSMGLTLCDKTMVHIEDFIKTAITLEAKSLRIGFADVFGRGKYLFEKDSNYKAEQADKFEHILELKRKYRKAIFIELPNINIDHVEAHDDIQTNVYRGSLACGCGSDYLVVSHTGEIRPCQMLPEAWFSLADKNALNEHICGNFHIKDLQEAIEKYYNDKHFIESQISPCFALEIFYEK